MGQTSVCRLGEQEAGTVDHISGTDQPRETVFNCLNTFHNVSIEEEFVFL